MIAIAIPSLGRTPVRPPDRPVKLPSITVVCCVESGPLETTTLMMVRSLRRWGGRFAGAPVIAVTPRFGPPLRRSTRKGFDELNIRHVRGRRISGEYSWYSFLNKPLSLVTAEETISTDLVVWLDADVFVTGEPEAFDLPAGVDFAGCPSDRNLGSTGPDDPFDPYWSRMCSVLGLTPDDLPWVNTCREKAKIRFYLNGGVLVYRRASGYAPAYLAGCIDVLNSRVASREAGLFFAEQVTAGLIACKRGLKTQLLPEQFNYAIGSKALDGFSPEAFAHARVLHYHDALWGHFFNHFLQMCRTGQPALYEWLHETGPLSNDAPVAWRVWAKVLKNLRAKKQNAFEASCERV
jgi:hypothetical protein